MPFRFGPILHIPPTVALAVTFMVGFTADLAAAPLPDESRAAVSASRLGPPFDAAHLAAPPDTFSDAGTRALILHAREARAGLADGLDSYDARMRESFYIGLDATGFRRERGIIMQERVAMTRWSADGERIVRWEGARRDIPLVGLSSLADSSVLAGLFSELGGSMPYPLQFDPGSDRLAFIGYDAGLDPLADTAGLHYRFRAGDTLRIALPAADGGSGGTITLAEVRVEPRRSEFRLITASFWFDLATGALVRAVYRPARPFDLAVDGDDGDIDDVPRVLRPIRAEIRVISVDHGLYDMSWWLPRRFLFEGEASVGRIARFPLRAEWSISDVEVNREIPPELAIDDLPQGWTVSENVTARVRDDSVHVVRILPPIEELARGGSLESLPPMEQATFSTAELREIEAQLGALLPPGGFAGYEVFWGTEDGVTRFNRVEGLATGIGARVHLPGNRTVRGVARVGTHAFVPTTEISLEGGRLGRRWRIDGYHRLVGASEWHEPTALSTSFTNAITGEGPTPWYRALGISTRMERGRSPSGFHIEGFAERHETAERKSDLHLRRAWNRDRVLADNIDAVDGLFYGLRGGLRWQHGSDPGRIRLFGRLLAEGAAGEAEYLRGSATTGFLLPLFGGWDAAVELGAGGSAGELPRQRRFFPGGSAGYRPVQVGEREGDSYWMARAELGTGFTGARGVLFVDALRVAVREADTLAPTNPTNPIGWARAPEVGAGIGASFLDGLLRMDLSRQLRPSGGWRVLFYFDALF